MTLFAEQGLDILFGPITEFFTWLEQVLWLLMIVGIIVVIIAIVLTIVASVGLGTIVGKVVNKAVSEELGEEETGGQVVEKEASEKSQETLSSSNQSGSGSGGSSSRSSLLGLIGTFLGLGIIPFTIFTAFKAGDYGYQDDWYRPVILFGLVGGIVFAIAYQRRRIRRLGKDKAGRGSFYFGLVFSAAAIGAMGSVTCTSLAYIAWQRAAVPTVIELPNITNTLGMTFNKIPAGTFTMGSPETEMDHHDDEHRHKVTISKAFYMQTTEVTQGQWQAVMGTEPWKSTEPWKGKQHVEEGANYPAVNVSWDDAVAYCKKLSEIEGKTYRLPTEAEWEYACRAGTQTTWSFGDAEKLLGDYAWYDENARDKGAKYAHQVVLRKPNPFGLYDMHGNVCEWCNDYYGEDYYKQSPAQDPTGPTSGVNRVFRGGSWFFFTRDARSAVRGSDDTDERNYYYGFRLVRELDDSEGLRLKVSAGKGELPPSPFGNNAVMDKAKKLAAALAMGDWQTVLALDPTNSDGLRLKADAEEKAAAEKAVILARAPITNKFGQTFKEIPAGTFTMGSPDTEKDRDDDEHQHKVTISKAFYMQTTEVTQGQWKAVMGTEPWKGEGWVKEGPNYPASYVSWDDAVAYCKKLSEIEGKTYRLPTEAEWEYACRAGTKTAWSFGDDEASLGDYAWYDENAWFINEKYAHQVGQKKPNAFGLYDMHGNVYEWCHDYFEEDYYKQSPAQDPPGPASGSSRVLRGGSWGGNSRLTRSANRDRDDADYRYNYNGFRLVRELD